MRELRAKLIRMVEASRTNPNAPEYLHEMLRQAKQDKRPWQEVQQIEWAIRHTERLERNAEVQGTAERRAQDILRRAAENMLG